ncbi:minor histocompatibility antigen H13 isoform X3 [Cinclus cinclus]|uniref:minor histocompatibility antigen H13 isoform X3 n=1 Tax=Cinclus cinclus TaxID=127875 RepID=UPI002E13C7FA
MEEPAAHNGSAAGAAPGAGTPSRPPATPEGMALAYGSLVLMALLPIFFGALRSVSCAKSKNSSEMPETITSRDAARFPIVASCTLLGLYLFFKIFSQEYINLLLSMYFFVLGILALSHTISPMMNRFFPANFPNKQYQLLFTQGSGESKEEIVNYEFDAKDLVCLALSSVVGVWYLLRKHWIANNLFGLAFSLNGVELLHLNNVSTGCILLGGLFIYDVFWPEEEHAYVFLHQLCGLHLWAGPHHIHHAHLQACPACAAVPGPCLHWIPASRGLGKGRSNRNVQLRGELNPQGGARAF